MERRALIAVLISVLILIIYQEIVIKRLYPPKPAPPRAAATPMAVEREAPPAAPDMAAPAAPPAEPRAPAAPAALPAGAVDVRLETELYTAVFTTAGGRLKSFTLSRFRTTVGPDSSPVDMVVDTTADALPLGVVLSGPSGPVSDTSVLYRVDQPAGLRLAPGETGELTFEGSVGGATVRRRVHATSGSYVLRYDVEVVDPQQQYKDVGLRWKERLTQALYATDTRPDSVIATQADKLHRYSPSCWFFDRLWGLCTPLQDDPPMPPIMARDVGWGAFSSRYFLAAMVPLTDGEPAAAGLQLEYADHTADVEVTRSASGQTARYELFIGPKEISLLNDAGHSLRKALDLGMFTFVALPLLHFLRFLYGFIGNYGVCIIILTVLIKVLFFPLTRKSFESMKAMQKLQPEMQKIRERLKEKPEEMNREIMELYRRHKVNPLGGCLPMLLQLPVFIGLYSALQNAIELRHAPFVGWITDLSAPDRLGTLHLPFVEHPGVPVLTLVMGATMFIQQWMTPSAGDPAPQRMMMNMPIIFTFMFINFPAGLTLYWLVNNILTIAQQFTMMRSAR
jgi:YidC/Oxa1 family membrane protein insertase